MIRHVAVFRFREGVTPEQKEEAVRRLNSLVDSVPSVRQYTAGLDLGRNPKNWEMCLVAEFDDEAGMEEYFSHPAHDEVASFIDGVVTESNITARVQFRY